MNENVVRDFLQALRRVARQVGLYPEGHPLTQEAMEGAERSVRELSTTGGEDVVLAVTEDSIYLNRSLLPHTSLEYNSLIAEMHERSIESITVTSPVLGADLYDLAAFVAGTSDDLPAGGTIRLNEAPYAGGDMAGSPLARVRRSYAGSLGAIRSASDTLAMEGAFDLRAITGTVEDLLDTSLASSGASLLLTTVKSHDEYTFYHSVNTCILSLALGQLAGLERSELVAVGSGALLHDIGKVAVSWKTLNHAGRLSEEQWAEVRLHPQEGAAAILAAGGPGSEVAASVAFEHHLRFDGGGYPHHSNHEGPPRRYTRLVQVADVYDSITTRRPYRRAETPNRALEVLIAGAGSHFDPDMVTRFVRVMGVYPPGSVVQVSTGELVVVTAQDDEYLRVWGLVVRDRHGQEIESEPLHFSVTDVVAHLLPGSVGIDVTSVVENAGDLLQHVGLPELR